MASRSRCDTAANENAKSSRDSRERSRTPIMRRDWGQVFQYHLATLRDSGGCSGLEFADLSEKLKSIHASKERLVCTNKKLRGENEELRLSMRDLEQMNVRLVEEKEKLEIDNRRLSMNGILEEGEIVSSDSGARSLGDALSLHQLGEERCQLQHEREKLAEEATRLEREAQDLHCQRGALEHDQKSLEAERAEFVHQLSLLEAQKSELESRCVELESERKMLESDKGNLAHERLSKTSGKDASTSCGDLDSDACDAGKGVELVSRGRTDDRHMEMWQMRVRVQELRKQLDDSKIEQLERKIQSLVETCRRQRLSILRHIREKGKLDAHSSESQ